MSNKEDLVNMYELTETGVDMNGIPLYEIKQIIEPEIERDVESGISYLLGKTIKLIEISEECIKFILENGEACEMFHIQDCCEDVHIEDIEGDIYDLVGVPILQAEEVKNRDESTKKENYHDSHTWTFYKLSTIKGSVTIRWYGDSNGYYSERVSFVVYKN